uniref:Uncharacterized protein n=1 Tax=Aegilops tauschii subsp. strangulata TaxID=200361 RepID=A0A453ABP3_AEGTS
AKRQRFPSTYTCGLQVPFSVVGSEESPPTLIPTVRPALHYVPATEGRPDCAQHSKRLQRAKEPRLSTDPGPAGVGGCAFQMESTLLVFPRSMRSTIFYHLTSDQRGASNSLTNGSCSAVAFIQITL